MERRRALTIRWGYRIIRLQLSLRDLRIGDGPSIEKDGQDGEEILGKGLLGRNRTRESRRVDSAGMRSS
jgi:hypothetical protein